MTVSVGSKGGKLGLDAPTDPDGNALTIEVTSLPRVGTLRFPNGTPLKVGQFLSASQLERLVYDAPSEYRSKKPVYFRYQVSDGQYVRNATVAIHIKRTAPANCFTALFGDVPGHPKVKLSKLPLKDLSPGGAKIKTNSLGKAGAAAKARPA